MIDLQATGLFSHTAVAEMIGAGKRLLIAGDERVLHGLPRGSWIGGTIPYFMSAAGGVRSSDGIFVTELPPDASVTIKRYTRAALATLAADHPGHGFSVLLLPAFSAVHQEFAEKVMSFPGVFDRPLVGWVAGVAVEDVGKVKPKVFDGATGAASDDEAVIAHVELAQHQVVSVDILNLFRPGQGDTLTFAQSGFSASEVLVNGEPMNLARYLGERKIDTRLPLVADYNGAMINVAIRDVDAAAGTVGFYGPVFPGTEYRIAEPVDDYVERFHEQIDPHRQAPIFACNCILNYVYAGLEGRSTRPITGPMSFGEIAYVLLNQTAVYLTVAD